MVQAAKSRGMDARTAYVDAGPVIVVSGPKGEVGCLVTETDFDVSEWAESIKARVT